MHTTLAPGLLLAAPALGDPNFSRSVVMLAEHDDEGAVGWVLNGRALRPAGDLLREAGLTLPTERMPSTQSYASLARVGGPVMPNSAWLLYRKSPSLPDYPSQHELGGLYAITSAREAIEAVAHGRGPENFRVLLGYAGWGPQQLEEEIQQGAWLPAELDGNLLFRLDAEMLWEAAYQAAVGSLPASFSSTQRGSA